MLKFTYYGDAVMNIHCRLREDKFSSHLKVLSDAVTVMFGPMCADCFMSVEQLEEMCGHAV